MGVVYEARDAVRGERVALKTMLRASGESLARFKREFRSLQDLSHPNLVQLLELFAEEDRWFFTMELVEGVDFLEHVRDDPPAELPSGVRDATTAATEPTLPASPLSHPVDARGEGERTVTERSSPYDEARLRHALTGLAQGIVALHDAGKVHRDIKPSNVRVTPSGRAVLLDFGLVFDAHGDATASAGLFGTPTYMAPEQAASQPVGPEADWYAVGVVLYEALTGRAPFEGRPLEVLMAKQRANAVPARERAPGVPSDLDALASALLAFDPAARPGGRDVLRALGAPPPARREASFTSRTQATPFVGRAREQEALAAARAVVEHGEPLAVLLHGESGVGKSALARRFCERLAAESPSTLVLSGRCYERETVPYKALDGIVDALAGALARMPDDRVMRLLPRHVSALTQVFPVLTRVRRVAAEAATPRATVDPHEVRRRAFAALRELLARFEVPLVLTIDDLQWADADSLELLANLLRPPDAPALLLLATVRVSADDDEETSPARLAERLACDTRLMPVDRLPTEDARELAASLLRRAGAHPETGASLIADEARGHPLFIDELVRHAAREGESPALKLDDALWSRIERLESEPRLVLELAAVIGGPATPETLAYAAEIDMPTFARAASFLGVANLLRSLGTRARPRFEPYHDRVREAVVARLTGDRRAHHHERVALAMEATREDDADALATHWTSAGAPERAARYAVSAARRAATALAFGRAVTLYRRAIELHAEEDPSRRELRARLADALACAGRGPEAAVEYKAAAVGANAADALELKRRAAEQLIRSGHFDDGMAAIGDVLATVRMRVQPSRIVAALSTLFWGFLVRLRGLSFVERDATQISQVTLTRIDLYWSVSAGIAIVDNVRAADFARRTLLLSLRAGEPYRIARVLAQEIMVNAVEGLRNPERTAFVAAKAEAVAAKTGDPHAVGFVTAMRGCAAYLEGRWRAAIELCSRGEQHLRDHCTGVAWETGTARIFALWAMFYLGRVGEMARAIPPLLDEARTRGDLYVRTNVGVGTPNVIWLAADAPERAEREIADAMSGWSRRHVHLQHYYEQLALAHVALYRGAPDPALASLEARWKGFEGAFVFRLQRTCIESRHLRARLRVASAQGKTGPERERLLRGAEIDARRIERERAPWGDALALLIRAAVANLRGRTGEARSFVSRAVPALDSADLALYAAVARRAEALLLGRDGDREVAERRIAQEDVARPDRFAAMLAPGLAAPR